MKKVKLGVISLVLVLSSLLGACSTAAPDPIDVEIEEIERKALLNPNSFVGKVEGTDAFIAIINFEGQIEAYICDGTPDAATISVWLEGTLTNNQLEAKSEDGKVTLTGTLTGTTLSVSVKGLNADPNATNAATATETNSPGGLWRALGNMDEFLADESKVVDLFKIGWIVLPDGTQRGAANKAGGVATTEPVNPGTGQNDEDVFPAGNPETEPVPEGDVDLCRLYHRGYHNAKRMLKQPVMAEFRDDLKETMRNALMLWNYECKGTYGNIGSTKYGDIN